MKTHSLFQYATIVLEAEDDLFPGLDSSVFDDALSDGNEEKDGIKRVRNLEDTLYNLYQLDKENIDKVEDHLTNNNALINMRRTDKPPGPNVVPYTSFDWFDKYPNVRVRVGSRGIDKSSPIFNTVEGDIRTLNTHMRRLMLHHDKLAQSTKERRRITDDKWPR